MTGTELPRFFVGPPPWHTKIMERVQGGPIEGGVSYLQMLHPPDVDFVCDALNEKAGRDTAEPADADMEKALEVMAATGRDPNKEWYQEATAGLAQALADARAAGRAEAMAEVRGRFESYFRRMEKRTEERAEEDPDHHLYHLGRSAAYEDAAKMVPALLAKLPETKP